MVRNTYYLMSLNGYFRSDSKKYDVVNVGICGNNYEVKNVGIYFRTL